MSHSGSNNGAGMSRKNMCTNLPKDPASEQASFLCISSLFLVVNTPLRYRACFKNILTQDGIVNRTADTGRMDC